MGGDSDNSRKGSFMRLKDMFHHEGERSPSERRGHRSIFRSRDFGSSQSSLGSISKGNGSLGDIDEMLSPHYGSGTGSPVHSGYHSEEGDPVPSDYKDSLASELFLSDKDDSTHDHDRDHHRDDHRDPNRHHHHSHLSLRRFLKKMKHKDHPRPKPNTVPQLHTGSGIFEKYGKGRLLGTGASGSVNLVTSRSDPSKIYAVKKFRPKLANETDRDYKTKVYNEFKIGENMKQENLIHTVELIKEANIKPFSDPEYYIIMEYCPFDFFNLVMSGLMTFNETNCYFKQIINGVAYLHENGLAHRDLKLDNCVVDVHGVLKLIDFGSAVQFTREKTHSDREKTPFDREIVDDHHALVLAKGVVGSDPYLAYEVFHSDRGYDPRVADVWSVAIIYCCMILRRFPWKIPQESDPSFKAFASIPDKSVAPLEDDLDRLNLEHMRARPQRGPGRLLYLLPKPSRRMVGRMLILDPKKRPLVHDLFQEEFYESIRVCHYHDGQFVPMDNHSHNLVTEEQLEKLNAERDKAKRMKDVGIH